MILPDDTLAEITRLARKGLDAPQIAERMNCRPFGEHWDLDVEEVQDALDQLALTPKEGEHNEGNDQ